MDCDVCNFTFFVNASCSLLYNKCRKIKPTIWIELEKVSFGISPKKQGIICGRFGCGVGGLVSSLSMVGYRSCFLTFHGWESILFPHFPWLLFHAKAYDPNFSWRGAPNFTQISFTFHAVRHLSEGLSSSGTLVKVRYALHKPKK